MTMVRLKSSQIMITRAGYDWPSGTFGRGISSLAYR